MQLKAGIAVGGALIPMPSAEAGHRSALAENDHFLLAPTSFSAQGGEPALVLRRRQQRRNKTDRAIPNANAPHRSTLLHEPAYAQANSAILARPPSVS